VSHECLGFRAALEAELLGRPSQERLSGLAWHGHLLSCADCRELLEREEALETLLASLPEPRLPSALAQRVLVRLREDRAAEVRLERLLDLDADLRAPRGLAAGVLAGLARERFASGSDRNEARLDEILDLDRDVRVPPGLAGRVLAGLSRERSLGRSPARPTLLRRRAWLLAVAAGLLLAFLGRLYWLRARPDFHRTIEPIVQVEPAPDPEMLAALDVLEEWDLLMQDDVDVLLSTLGPADLALLDYR
jgi:predicted anti-sigma-YlaC factor YlaD